MRNMTRITAAALALATIGFVAPLAGQGAADEAVMVAAAQWVKNQLPPGALRVDPHRTGEGIGQGLAQKVARAVGADLGTLEETRRCTDVMDAASCRLESAALVAVSPPRVDGDQATVRVYAWYRQDRPREPVGKRSWDLQLRRSAGGWTVVSGGR